MTLEVLNLYAGIGGNRKLWDDVTDVDVTAVEIEEEIAQVYEHYFPEDKMVVGDAHDYLEEHYDEFDFIWTSPPCTSHSKLKKNLWVKGKGNDPEYPDLKLYDEILFLKHYFDGDYVVENVDGFYDPLVKPQEIHRHYIWSNFHISDVDLASDDLHTSGEKNTIAYWEEKLGFDLSRFDFSPYWQKRKNQILRNCVKPVLGKHILKAATIDRQATLFE